MTYTFFISILRQYVSVSIIILGSITYTIASELNTDPVALVDSLNNLSYNNRRSNPKQSLEHSIKAYEIAQNLNYSKGLGFAIHNMGTAKAVLGSYDKGMIDLFEASRIREEIADYKGLASTYNNIGFIYSQMGDNTRALEFYEKALEQQKKTSHKRDFGIILNNIGHVYFRNNNLNEALDFFYQALAVNEDDNDERGASASKSNIGTVYRRMGEYEKGLEYHYQAYEIGKKHDDKYGIISTLRYIAESYIHLNQIEKATTYALRSILLAQEIGSLGEEKETTSLLAKIYEKRGRFQESMRYYKQESRLKDSLFNLERAQAIGRLQSAYELESKAKENEFLKKEQEINSHIIRQQRYSLILSGMLMIIAITLLATIYNSRRKIKSTNTKLVEKNEEISSQKQIIQEKVNNLDEKNQELKKINQIKDKLISIIAHDLKNPFNSISGYSELLITQPDSYTSSEFSSFLSIIHDNSNKGSMLLDNLLQWSRIQTHTLQYIPVEQNLYKLVYDELHFVQHIANDKQIKLLTNIPENQLVYADSNMLKTVIRNLLANALKFTPNNGEISIKTEDKNNCTTIEIKDKGEGIDPNIKDKLFTGEAGVTTASQSGEKGTGLGLMLCKDFIDKHKGKIWVESELNIGSSFYISLPNKREKPS